jgi:hypothetical protein
MLFQPFTVVKKDSVAGIQKVLDKVSVKGYPLPSPTATIVANSADGTAYFDEIGAANMYNKKVGRIEYRITPSNLLSQNEFWFHSHTRNILLSYPLIYKGDSVVHIKDTSILSVGNHRYIILQESLQVQGPVNKDTSFSAEFLSFNPDAISLVISSESGGIYCLFQNYYPRWQLSIDSKEAPLYKVNQSFIGFQLPPGKHQVNLTYHSSDLKMAFYISLFVLILLSAILIIPINRIKV